MLGAGGMAVGRTFQRAELVKTFAGSYGGEMRVAQLSRFGIAQIRICVRRSIERCAMNANLIGLLQNPELPFNNILSENILCLRWEWRLCILPDIVFG
jgi:hypothetical protein